MDFKDPYEPCAIETLQLRHQSLAFLAQSFLQLCAIFASCTLIEHASFLKSRNCILNNPLPIVWWQ